MVAYVNPTEPQPPSNQTLGQPVCTESPECRVHQANLHRDPQRPTPAVRECFQGKGWFWENWDHQRRVDRSVYFQTPAFTQKAIENDLLDTNLLVRLRELRNPRIDCRALETAYPDQRPPTPEVIEVQAVAQKATQVQELPHLPLWRRAQAR